MSTQTVPALFAAAAQRIYESGLAADVGRRCGQTGWTFETYLADVMARAPFCRNCANLASVSQTGTPLDLRYSLCEPRAGLVAACRAGAVTFEGDDTSFVAFEARHAVPADPYWVLLNPGRGYRSAHPGRVRKALTGGVSAARVMDGVCTLLHHPDLLKAREQYPWHGMYLPGSVHNDDIHNAYAYLCPEARGTLLDAWVFGEGDDICSEDYGTAFVVHCSHRR